MPPAATTCVGAYCVTRGPTRPARRCNRPQRRPRATAFTISRSWRSSSYPLSLRGCLRTPECADVRAGVVRQPLSPLGKALDFIFAKKALEQAKMSLLVAEDVDHHV